MIIGEGDLSQNLGHPPDYEHPVVVEVMDEILRICKANNDVCHPHIDSNNIETMMRLRFGVKEDCAERRKCQHEAVRAPMEWDRCGFGASQVALATP